MPISVGRPEWSIKITGKRRDRIDAPCADVHRRRVDRIHVHLRACNGEVGAQGWWWRRRTKGAKSGEGQGVEDTERVARSRSRREKPSKCRGPCIQAARRADGTRRSVAACTGLIAGHRSTDVPMRERNERKRDGAGMGAKGSEEERKGEAERKNGRAEGGELSLVRAAADARIALGARGSANDNGRIFNRRRSATRLIGRTRDETRRRADVRNCSRPGCRV